MLAEVNPFESVLAQSLVAIAVVEPPNHTFTYANAAFIRLVGDVEVLGMPLLLAMPDLRTQGFNELLDDVMRTGVPFEAKEAPSTLAHRAGGKTQYASFSYQPRRDSNGNIDGVLITAFDVTEQVQVRHRLEAQRNDLRLNQLRLEQTLDATGVGTWELRVESGIFVMDSAFASVLGLREEGALGDFLAKVHPDDVAKAADAIHASLGCVAPKGMVTEYRVLASNGSTRWLSTRIQAFTNDAGETTRIIGAAVDITEWKKSDASRAAFLASIAAQDVFGVAVLTGDALRFEVVNDALRRIAGRRDLQGKPIVEAIPEIVGQGIVEAMREVLRTGVAKVGREQAYKLDLRGDGQVEDRCFDYIWQPVVGASGETQSLLIITNDVTDSVRARRREIAHLAEVEERAAFEKQLIGIVSHDLKNPLSSIQLASAALLRNRGLPERSRKGLLRIRSAAERSARMVKDLLDFTQARIGRGIRIQSSPMDLREAAAECVEELRSAFPERDIRFEVTGDSRGEWDRDRLAQVVHNLVSNALSYSPPGTYVELKLEGEADEDVSLCVHNLGPPIPAAARERLFQPFERGTSPSQPGSRSVGLGLFIVQHIVDAHGGRISVESSAGAGTTFRVSLPRHLRDERSDATPPAPSTRAQADPPPALPS